MAPLDLHCSPESSKQTEVSVSQEILNKSTDSVDSKKSSSEASSSPGKNRRKRKPNVTKKVTAAEAVLSDPDAETGIGDVEQELTTNVISNDLKVTNPESDECETIDKIAQMVSSITSNVELTQTVEASNDQQPKGNDGIIEDQLEQMFADCEGQEPQSVQIAKEDIQTSTDQPNIDVKKKKVAKPRKKKVDSAVVVKKKQPGVGPQKLKNGKPGRKPKNASESIDKVELKDKTKSKDSKKLKMKGDIAPFVQLQKDGSFAIVNQKANGDDDAEKTVGKPKKGPQTEKNKAIRGLHVSTLSNKYDADKRDTTWVCVFCKLGPHKHKLGDLFGPYIISTTSEEYANSLQDPAADPFRQSNKNKFVKAVLPPTSPEKPKKKRKLNDSQKASSVVNGTAITNEELFSGMSKVDDTNLEVWFHEDCILWANGTYMIGTKVIGMEAAIWSSTRYRCAYCNKNGAMISCLSRECRKPAHMGCAKNTWKLDDEFKSYCELHSNILPA